MMKRTATAMLAFVLFAWLATELAQPVCAQGGVEYIHATKDGTKDNPQTSKKAPAKKTTKKGGKKGEEEPKEEVDPTKFKGSEEIKGEEVTWTNTFRGLYEDSRGAWPGIIMVIAVIIVLIFMGVYRFFFTKYDAYEAGRYRATPMTKAASLFGMAAGLFIIGTAALSPFKFRLTVSPIPNPSWLWVRLGFGFIAILSHRKMRRGSVKGAALCVFLWLFHTAYAGVGYAIQPEDFRLFYTLMAIIDLGLLVVSVGGWMAVRRRPAIQAEHLLNREYSALKGGKV
ncbi:MAG TPA: hypothetical protein PL033_11945 [Candidatus Brocadiia bacterium]|nr:hypothetical protein [Candidatus Brocadiia bacterium]